MKIDNLHSPATTVWQKQTHTHTLTCTLTHTYVHTLTEMIYEISFLPRPSAYLFLFIFENVVGLSHKSIKALRLNINNHDSICCCCLCCCCYCFIIDCCSSNKKGFFGFDLQWGNWECVCVFVVWLYFDCHLMPIMKIKTSNVIERKGRELLSSLWLCCMCICVKKWLLVYVP